MRAGEDSFLVSEQGGGDTWKIGRPIEEAWSGRGWATPFSCFRFAIPQICGFDGRAIYLDADMLVLGDIQELWRMDIGDYGMRCISTSRTDVALIDCGWFKDKKWWPKVNVMKEHGAGVGIYVNLLGANNGIRDDLPPEWNDCDAKIYAKEPDSVKLIHYTHVLKGQPYRPYPTVTYPQKFPFCDTHEGAGRLWWAYYREALEKEVGPNRAEQLISQQAKER